MMPTGGTSITKIARFIARWPSFGVAFAFALHIAQPWANAGARPKRTSNSKHSQTNLRSEAFMIPTATSLPTATTRPASGKKKKYMMMKHAVTEITSIQRISARFKLQVHEVANDQRRLDDRQNSSTSSMRTGSNICLYPSTTSIAVRTSSAPHTQKYCPLLSSCVATSCIVFSSSCHLSASLRCHAACIGLRR